MFLQSFLFFPVGVNDCCYVGCAMGAGGGGEGVSMATKLLLAGIVMTSSNWAIYVTAQQQTANGE